MTQWFQTDGIPPLIILPNCWNAWATCRRAFFSWDRLPGRQRPHEPIPTLAPELAVEVLRRSNTPGEMHRKREDYFAVGVRLVWEVDPDDRTVHVYTALEPADVVLTKSEPLDGGNVLVGFKLPLASLFAELDRQG